MARSTITEQLLGKIANTRIMAIRQGYFGQKLKTTPALVNRFNMRIQNIPDELKRFGDPGEDDDELEEDNGEGEE